MSTLMAAKRSHSSDRLAALARDAHEFVPFYRGFWRDIDPRTLHDACKFSCLPILSKADLLKVAEVERIDRRRSLHRLSRESTSGSTGQPFTMYFDRRVWLRRRVRFIRALLACGYRFGQSLMLISSRHTSTLMRLARWHYVDLTLGERALCTRYQQIKPQTLYGPLSSLLVLAHRLFESPDNRHRPELVISTAEQLNPAHRRLFEDVFQAPVADLYGSTELGLVAWRAPGAETYEWAERDFHLEFIPFRADSPMERLIVTDLSPSPSPLIRFDTGDLIQRDAGKGLRAIKEIAGRTVDCLRMPDDGLISPYEVTMAMEEIPAVERYEVVQRAEGNIDIFFWTSASDPSSAQRQAQAAVEQLCRRQVPVAAHHSTEPLELTGRKIRPVRSEAEKHESIVAGV